MIRSASARSGRKRSIPASRSMRPSSASCSTTTATKDLVTLPTFNGTFGSSGPLAGSSACVPDVTSVIGAVAVAHGEARTDEIAGGAMQLEDVRERLAKSRVGGGRGRPAARVNGRRAGDGGEQQTRCHRRRRAHPCRVHDELLVSRRATPVVHAGRCEPARTTVGVRARVHGVDRDRSPSDGDESDARFDHRGRRRFDGRRFPTSQVGADGRRPVRSDAVDRRRHGHHPARGLHGRAGRHRDDAPGWPGHARAAGCHRSLVAARRAAPRTCSDGARQLEARREILDIVALRAGDAVTEWLPPGRLAALTPMSHTTRTVAPQAIPRARRGFLT